MFEVESVRPLSAKGEISPFVIEDWGLIVYQEAVQKQMELVQAVKNGSKPDTLVFCRHHPVVTLGRATEEEDIQDWQGEIHEASRGGRATYHGPSQLVVYPIFSLERERGYLARPRDVHSYLRCLEACLVASLVSYELPAEVKSVGVIDNTSLRMTGVWVGNRKIASIGVSIRSWVTYHGLALNVDLDPQAFQGIKPCGFESSTMVSMEELLGYQIDRKELKQRILTQFLHSFS
jgi:lipoyl(octanoyl) transferase